MREEKTKEGKEVFREIDLQIVLPSYDQTYMVAFTETQSELLVHAYNKAIEGVLLRGGFKVLHQLGKDNPLEYQAWEVLKGRVSTEKLEGLLPEMHKQARLHYK